MQSDQRPVSQQSLRPPRNRSAALVAAAAFIVVLVVGIGLFAIVDRPSDPVDTTAVTSTAAPTTTTIPPTTTTAATTSSAPTTTPAPQPAIDAEDQAFVAAMVADLNSGDIEAAVAGIAAAESFIGPINQFNAVG